MKLEEYGWQYKIWTDYRDENFFPFNSGKINSQYIKPSKDGTLIDLYLHGRWCFLTRLSISNLGTFLVEYDGANSSGTGIDTPTFSTQNFQDLKQALSFIYSIFKDIKEARATEKYET